jgi:hypothetical protein
MQFALNFGAHEGGHIGPALPWDEPFDRLRIRPWPLPMGEPARPVRKKSLATEVTERRKRGNSLLEKHLRKAQKILFFWEFGEKYLRARRYVDI